MQAIQIQAEGHYCLNPECGADSDHLAVWEQDGVIHVGCYVCEFHGTEA
jgi:Zn ribbon nucleic-acid-binding protein